MKWLIENIVPVTSFVVACIFCWFIWSWHDRGLTIDGLEKDVKEYALANTAISEKLRKEEVLNDETDRRIADLEASQQGNDRPACAAVRAAINSLR